MASPWVKAVALFCFRCSLVSWSTRLRPPLQQPPPPPRTKTATHKPQFPQSHGDTWSWAPRTSSASSPPWAARRHPITARWPGPTPLSTPEEPRDLLPPWARRMMEEEEAEWKRNERKRTRENGRRQEGRWRKEKGKAANQRNGGRRRRWWQWSSHWGRARSSRRERSAGPREGRTGGGAGQSWRMWPEGRWPWSPDQLRCLLRCPAKEEGNRRSKSYLLYHPRIKVHCWEGWSVFILCVCVCVCVSCARDGF